MTLVNSRLVRGRCPCGALHAACGPPSTSTPIDEILEVAVVGGPLRKYNVTLPGGRTTVMKLNEADAGRYEATPVDGRPAPAAEAPPVAEKADEGAPDKSRAADNKSRTARGKAAPGGD